MIKKNLAINYGRLSTRLYPLVAFPMTSVIYFGTLSSLAQLRAEFGVTRGDVMLLSAPHTFDPSVIGVCVCMCVHMRMSTSCGKQ